jgi:hypothetical protein
VKKFLLPLVLLSSVAYADSFPMTAAYVTRTGSISAEGAVLYGTSGNLIFPITVDGNGAITANITTTNGVSALSPTSMVAVDATSATAQVVNLTNAAGVSGPCMVCLASNGGAAAGFKVQFGMSATAPVNLTSSSVGSYVAASTTSQCWGPFVAGTHLYAAGVAATSSVLYHVQAVKSVAGAQ